MQRPIAGTRAVAELRSLANRTRQCQIDELVERAFFDLPEAAFDLGYDGCFYGRSWWRSRDSREDTHTGRSANPTYTIDCAGGVNSAALDRGPPPPAVPRMTGTAAIGAVVHLPASAIEQGRRDLSSMSGTLTDSCYRLLPA